MQEVVVEEVVIVGGGIAGLATALALKRVGIHSLVLERHHELRTTGASLGLQPNAWRALRALGVAHKLAALYHPIEKARVTNLETGRTQEVNMQTEQSDPLIATRAVHRKVLLEVLTEQLPPETIRFNSKVVSIKKENKQDCSENTIIQLEDGTILRAKALIGCDGVHSVVAQWLGLSQPANSGRFAIRGLAVYPEGHSFTLGQVQQYLGVGIRAAFLPLNQTAIYWFFTGNATTSEKEFFNKPELLLQEVTDNLTKDFPEEYLDIVRHSDLSSLSWAPLLFRVPWNVLFGPTYHGAITVAGDAFHPMTPDLGQGGGCALEDAVVLARCLSCAKNPTEGIAEYVKERRGRAALFITGAYMSGWVQQGGTNINGLLANVARWFRDRIFYKFVQPKLAELSTFDCGDLIVTKN